MTQLSVNVNKLATLRNSRGKNLPNVLEMSEKILRMGVHGLTVHPRPDQRHIRWQDVYDLSNLVKTWERPVEFNVEGYPSAEFLKYMQEIRPHQCTLVPDPPEALTSNAGWDLLKHESQLKTVIAELSQFSRVSLFVEPAHFTPAQSEALARLQPASIELYTEAYADAFAISFEDKEDCKAVLSTYKATAEFARGHGIGVNAGHDLNQENLSLLISEIPWIREVSIGHALFCEAIEQGLKTTVANYLKILRVASASQ